MRGVARFAFIGAGLCPLSKKERGEDDEESIDCVPLVLLLFEATNLISEHVSVVSRRIFGFNTVTRKKQAPRFTALSIQITLRASSLLGVASSLQQKRKPTSSGSAKADQQQQPLVSSSEREREPKRKHRTLALLLRAANKVDARPPS